MQRRDPLDPLVVDVGERDARAECHRRQDRHLRRRVGALDVVARVGLGVAARLRLGEGLGVDGATLHLAEDEVRRPVDDPEHPVHVRDDERLAQHFDHRDRGADARLEAELDAGRLRRLEQLGAPLRDELLVRRDDRLAGAQSVEDVAAGRLDPAHDLGDDGDQGIVDDRLEVGRQDAVRRRELALLLDVAHERAHDPEPVSRRALDVVAALLEEAGYGRADGAIAEERDGDVNGRHAPGASRPGA